MRILSYLLIAVFLLAGCTSVYGQDEKPTPTPEEVRYVTRFAEEGYADEQFNLGLMYDQGEGVPQDYQLAMKWYKRAAEQGDANAQFNLGVMYQEGLGVPKDYVSAYKWYSLAADQVSAYKWYSLSADQGQKDAGEGPPLDAPVFVGRMTPSQIQKAQKLAREFKPKKEKPLVLTEMNEMDYFASHWISLILSYFESIIILGPLLFSIALPFFIPRAKKDIDYLNEFPSWFLIWMYLCLFIFSPMRYVFFPILLTVFYPNQSFSAWLKDIWFLWGLASIGFVLLVIISFSIPALMASSHLLAAKHLRRLRMAFSTILFPFGCWIATIIFFSLLPYAIVPFRGLNPRDVIRATNGPPSYLFTYYSSPGMPLRVSKLYFKTQQTPRDLVRFHVALTYLSPENYSYFFEKAYPDLLNLLKE